MRLFYFIDSEITRNEILFKALPVLQHLQLNTTCIKPALNFIFIRI